MRRGCDDNELREIAGMAVKRKKKQVLDGLVTMMPSTNGCERPLNLMAFPASLLCCGLQLTGHWAFQ
jgi:hypothetical protein